MLQNAACGSCRAIKQQCRCSWTLHIVCLDAYLVHQNALLHMRQHITGLLTVWLWSQYGIQRPHVFCLPPLFVICMKPASNPAVAMSRMRALPKKDAVTAQLIAQACFNKRHFNKRYIFNNKTQFIVMLTIHLRLWVRQGLKSQRALAHFASSLGRIDVPHRCADFLGRAHELANLTMHMVHAFLA